MGERMRGNEYRTTVVCVDSYENGVLAGRFYNPACPEGIVFKSLTQLLIKVQDLLDDMRFPQSFTVARAFSDVGGGPEENAAPPGARQEGRLGTFAVRILFRQNASWQGSVTWMEGNQEGSFRSVLELVLLMDSALREGRT